MFTNGDRVVILEDAYYCGSSVHLVLDEFHGVVLTVLNGTPDSDNDITVENDKGTGTYVNVECVFPAFITFGRNLKAKESAPFSSDLRFVAISDQTEEGYVHVVSNIGEDFLTKADHFTVVRDRS